MIKDKIHTIRGVQVILDRDLAELYGVTTKVLNQAVKRNMARFPPDFMFQLTEKEKTELVTKCDHLKTLKYSLTLPNVFTEQGVASLSGVLKSKKAIEVNIQIMRAFVAMRRFISKNAEIFRRLGTIERKQLVYDESFRKVFQALEIKKPKQGIFFDGQIFDAYKFVLGLVRSANHSIVLIDNYVDDTVLTLFSKRKKGVKVIIYTKFTKQLQLDLDKYNSQYPLVTIKNFNKSHDRFLILDEKKVYHIGASLKDLGKKWFAFSRIDSALKLLDKLERKV